MTIEGTFVYSCPVPDSVAPATPGVPYPVVPLGPLVIGSQTSDLQGLLDTIAAQRQELEALRGALALVLDLLTPQQRQALQAVTGLLCDAGPLRHGKAVQP